MLREDRELLSDLARVNTQVPGFVLEFMDGSLSAEAEEAFAYQLVDVAEQIMRHAKSQRRLVINGYATELPELSAGAET